MTYERITVTQEKYKVKRIIISVFFVLLQLTTTNCKGADKSWSNEQKNEDLDSLILKKANKLAERIQIIDCHSHSLFRLDNDKEKQITFSSLKSGSINNIVQAFPVNRSSEGSLSEQIIADLRSVIEEMNNKMAHASLVLSSKDLMNRKDNSEPKVVFAIESFKGLSEGNLSLMQKYYDEGVREIGINSSGDDKVYEDELLTEYGKNYVKELNRLGMICDITHIRKSIQSQIIDLSQAPVIISHGGAIGAVASGFNTPDSILDKLVNKGGMIGVTLYSGQISNKTLKEIDSGVDWKEASRANIEELIDHIDYLKERIGIDYISIGSDYGGSGQMSPSGLETIKGYPLIIYYMLKRGYTEEEIEKIMGLNFVRYWERVENTAQNIKP